MNELKINHTEWNLKPLFESDNDPKIESERKEIKSRVDNFVKNWRNTDSYLKDSLVLKKALEEYESLNLTSSGEDGSGSLGGYYFWLRTQQDQNNPAIKAKYNQAIDFLNKIDNEMRFFLLKLAKIPEDSQKKMLSHPDLKKYKHPLEKLFLISKHMLNEEEEKILSMKSRPSHENWTKMTSGFLSKEERPILLEDGTKKAKNLSEIASLLSNKNKKVRDHAALALNDILKKHAEVAEAEINSILYNKKVDDELRNFPSPDSARHLTDDIDSKVIETLISSVSSRFDIAKRFYELKAKLMGCKKLEYHERNVPYGKLDKKYSFNEAINLVYKVFSNLDKEFADILAKFIENGQIDVFPKAGKRGGAFCTDSLINQPTFILLNHTEELRDVLTIAHELGHGINAELMRKKQNPLTYGMVLSTAEVASTFMEDFVLQELLKEADEETRLALMMRQLDDNVSTILRQIACYKFERELHKEFRERGYLSKEEIGKIFQENMFAYMGDYVEKSPGSENWWIQWPHIRNFFYVYSYAFGLLISKAMQNQVKKDKKFIEKVKEFLSAGNSDSPKNIFLNLGIDISDPKFWNSGLKEIESLLNETEVLAKKLGKIKN